MQRTISLEQLLDAQTAFIKSYKNLLAECVPGQLNEATLRRTIYQIEAYLGDSSTENLPPAEAKAFSDFRRGVRRALTTLLQRAPWMGSPTKQLVEQCRNAQPEFIDDRFRFTDDYSSNYRNIWPEIFRDIAGRPGLVFVEVGSYEGMSACWFLTHVLTHPTSKLICIDPFLDNEDLEGTSLFGRNLDSAGGTTLDRFLFNIHACGKADHLSLLRQYSNRALRTLEPSSLDAAYIDGSHHSCDVIEDAILVWGALKPDGIMIFDDYHWAPPLQEDPFAAPKPAIDAFLTLFADRLRVLHHESQVIVQKKQGPPPQLPPR